MFRRIVLYDISGVLRDTIVVFWNMLDVARSIDVLHDTPHVFRNTDIVL